jgi:hypothetical protein
MLEQLNIGIPATVKSKPALQMHIAQAWSAATTAGPGVRQTRLVVADGLPFAGRSSTPMKSDEL